MPISDKAFISPAQLVNTSTKYLSDSYLERSKGFRSVSILLLLVNILDLESWKETMKEKVDLQERELVAHNFLISNFILTTYLAKLHYELTGLGLFFPQPSFLPPRGGGDIF